MYVPNLAQVLLPGESRSDGGALSKGDPAYAGLTGKETVIDAYCGIGTIGLIAAGHAGQVIGVELNKDAVRDAVINAKRNQIKNVQFYQADAGKFMLEMAEQFSAAGGRGKAAVDVVFMDPPRAGSDEAFLSSVEDLRPSASCMSPVTHRRLGGI